MLHLYWGNGKGKTTAAMGLALRALGHGRRVVIVQFLKDGTSGEIAPLRTAGATVYACPNAKFTWLMDENDKAQARAVSADALEKALAQPFDLLVLDEACAALKSNILDEALLRKAAAFAKGGREVVVTGPLAAGRRRLLYRNADAQAPLHPGHCRPRGCGVLTPLYKTKTKAKRRTPTRASSAFSIV